MTLKHAKGSAEDTAPTSTNPPPPEDPSFVTYLAVRQAMNALNRLQERYVVNQPASEIQSYVCAMLVRVGRPLRMGDIARFLCLEPQTITGLVSRMEAKGLVRRIRSTEDRRQVLVDVTDDGRARWEHAMLLTQTVRRQAFAEMSIEEHVRLAGVMLGIRDTALSALGENPVDANALMREIFPAQTLAPFEAQLPIARKKRRRAVRATAPSGDEGAAPA